MKTLETRRFSSTQKEAKNVDFSCILVVYKSKEGYWKGFAHPYDVTTQSTSAKSTLNQLKELVDSYEDRLRKLDYPSHLTHKPLTDLEDREKFSKVLSDWGGRRENRKEQTSSYYVETKGV